ncbi:FtsW/RodA/SpoVE family cell cycle protein, partial [Acinetobacter baumannii]
MVFASVVFATGWLGGFVVLLLYFLLFARGLSLALRLPGPLGLVALGLTLYLTLQAALNIGVTVGFLPVTGVPLPLVSYGGSSL